MSIVDWLAVGAATSIKRPDDVVIPPLVAEAANVRPRDWFRAAIYDDGHIVLRRAKSGGFPFENGVVRLTRDITSQAGIEAGDTLAFSVVGAGRIRFEKVEGTELESYHSPDRDDDGPIPPSWLIQPFTGRPVTDTFLESGARTAKVLNDIVKTAGDDLGSLESFLDFGCGSGRILRCMSRYTNALRVGTDLHEPAIAWNRHNYDNAEFFVGTEYPPTPRADNEFELLYAVSVLTHLDETHQDAWLREWQRIVKPGGLVIATFRAEDYLELVAGPGGGGHARQLAKSNGLLFVETDGWEGVFDAYYGGAYHRRQYVVEHWSRFFDILWLGNAGDFGNRQNVAVMRKRSASKGA